MANPLIATLKPQSNGPSYSNTVVSTLAGDGQLLHLVQRGGDWVEPQPAQPLLAVPNVTSHPVYQLRIIRCGTIIAFKV